MLLSGLAVILYKADLRMVLQDIHINFTLPADTYSIDEINAKVKSEGLIQRQDWEVLQIKDSKVSVPEHYIFIASNIVFIGFI